MLWILREEISVLRERRSVGSRSRRRLGLAAIGVLLASLVIPVVEAQPAGATTYAKLPQGVIYELRNYALNDTMYSISSTEASELGYVWTGNTTTVWLPEPGRSIYSPPQGLHILWRIRIGSLHALTIGNWNYPGAVFEAPLGYLAGTVEDVRNYAIRYCILEDLLHQYEPWRYDASRGYFTKRSNVGLRDDPRTGGYRRATSSEITYPRDGAEYLGASPTFCS